MNSPSGSPEEGGLGAVVGTVVGQSENTTKDAKEEEENWGKLGGPGIAFSFSTERYLLIYFG